MITDLTHANPRLSYRYRQVSEKSQHSRCHALSTVSCAIFTTLDRKRREECHAANKILVTGFRSRPDGTREERQSVRTRAHYRLTKSSCVNQKGSNALTKLFWRRNRDRNLQADRKALLTGRLCDCPATRGPMSTRGPKLGFLNERNMSHKYLKLYW